jgi:hypothetical protein
MAEEAAQEKAQQVANGNNIKLNESKVKDIEEVVLDGAFEKRRLDKILDKTRQVRERWLGSYCSFTDHPKAFRTRK